MDTSGTNKPAWRLYHSLLTAHPALQHTSHSQFDTRSRLARPPCSLAAPVIYSTRLAPGLSPVARDKTWSDVGSSGLTERFMAQLRPFVGALPPAATALGSSPRNQTQTGGLGCEAEWQAKHCWKRDRNFCNQGWQATPPSSLGHAQCGCQASSVGITIAHHHYWTAA